MDTLHVLLFIEYGWEDDSDTTDLVGIFTNKPALEKGIDDLFRQRGYSERFGACQREVDGKNMRLRGFFRVVEVTPDKLNTFVKYGF